MPNARLESARGPRPGAAVARRPAPALDAEVLAEENVDQAGCSPGGTRGESMMPGSRRDSAVDSGSSHKPVFISYARRTSAERARALLTELGPDICFLDRDDIELLEEFPRRLSEALLGARIVVAFPDATYFERWYCLREWMLALAPWVEVMRSDGSPELGLALDHLIVALPPEGLRPEDGARLPTPVSRWNLPVAADAKGLATLIRARLGEAGPTLRERFVALRVPERRRTLLCDPEPVPRPPLRMGAVRCNLDNLRPSIRDAFVGRANDLWRLHDLLSTQRMGGRAVGAVTGALAGGGGLGKTRLAVEYARRVGPSEYPGGVFWVDASKPERLSSELRSVLRAALAPEQRDLVDKLPERDLRDAVRSALLACAGQADVLYVVDNLPEVEAGGRAWGAEDFCPALEEVTCLVTSRTLQGYGGRVRPLPVDVLTESAAVTLLSRELEPAGLTADEWREIANWAGRLPLVLELLSGAMSQGGATPAEILQFARGAEVAEVHDTWVDALRGQVTEEDIRSTAQVFELSYRRLDEGAQVLARRLAWCAPTPIPLELIRDLTGPGAFIRARALLVGRSFLTAAREEGGLEGALSMHRVVASFLRAHQEPREDRAVLFRTVCRRIESADVDETAARPLLLALLPHLDAQVDWARRSGHVEDWSVWERVLEPLEALGARLADASPLGVRIRVAQLLVDSRPRERDPEGWARSLVHRGSALSLVGEREEGTGRLKEAVTAYLAALQVYTRESLPLQWAMTQDGLGNALSELGEREEGTERLEEAIAAYRAALEVRAKDRLPLDWAMTQNNLGTALWRLGEREEGTGRLDEAVTACRAALEVYTKETLPLPWAETQDNLGNALLSLGEREEGTRRLEEAVAAYRAALEVRTKDRLPLDWATTQNNLGNALWGLGEREEGTGHLEGAVAACRAALEVHAKETLPVQWAMTQNNLGNALSSLGEREEGTGRLEEAVAAYRAALEFYTKESLPLDWAMTQNNLGNALSSLGEREEGTGRLEEAVAACRAALEIRTKESLPLDWTMTQNSLGNALSSLGEREEDTGRLEQAVAAYRAALAVRTKKRLPLDWAMTQNNLGSALSSLGEREEGTGRLEEAVAAYRAALEVYTRESLPLDWAMAQNNLGEALSELGEREEGIRRLEEAVAACRAALGVYTRERLPLDWAMAQDTLGNALSKLGEREEGTLRLEQAVAAYRAALEVRTKESLPLDWAMTQKNLGNALWRLGEREEGTGHLEEAAAAYCAALEGTSQDANPYLHRAAASGLAHVSALLDSRRV